MQRQRGLVDDAVREQSRSIQVFVASGDARAGNGQLHGRGIQGALHRQIDAGSDVVDTHVVACGRLRAHRQRAGLDAAQDVHDAAVFKEGLVVEKAPQLLRQQSRRTLRLLSGLQPVVMHTPQARVGRQTGHRFQLQHSVEQCAQFILPVARHQEAPEGPKASALVGLVDQVAFAQDVLQQRPLAAVP